ncbi:unnamed protein product [Ectocarpus sp. 12 AP-2014]
MADDEALFSSVSRGDLARTRALLAAGASVDGSRKLDCCPLAVAAARGDLDMTSLLIDRGAKLDLGAPRDVHNRLTGALTMAKGARPIHTAIGSGQYETFRLLMRAGADPNVANVDGFTPLMSACLVQRVGPHRASIVRELLDGGADPAMVDTYDLTAMHFAAGKGRVELIDMLAAKAPATLHRAGRNGFTPLGKAAAGGEAAAAARILRLMSTVERRPPPRTTTTSRSRCPLNVAMEARHWNVVDVLLDNVDPIKSSVDFGTAISSALVMKRARLLSRLVSAVGEERKQKNFLAGMTFSSSPILHIAAAQADPLTTSVLLAAGAEESVVDAVGRSARDVVAMSRDVDSGLPDVAATRRMLERGPAFRARAWAWPATPTAAAATTSPAAAVSRVRQQRSSFVVRVCRRPPHFARTIARYAGKEKEVAERFLVADKGKRKKGGR